RIEAHYGRYMHGDAGQLALLGAGKGPRGGTEIRAVSGLRTETLPETFSPTPKSAGSTRRRGGDSNSRGLLTLAVFKTAALNRARPPLRQGPLSLHGRAAEQKSDASPQRRASAVVSGGSSGTPRRSKDEAEDRKSVAEGRRV